jgi:hypothetical protein
MRSGTLLLIGLARFALVSVWFTLRQLTPAVTRPVSTTTTQEHEVASSLETGRH